MPRPNHNDVPVPPLGYTMSISLIVHVGFPLEAHGALIKDTRVVQVDARVARDSAPSHVDPASHLNGLLIPQRLKVFVLDHFFALGFS